MNETLDTLQALRVKKKAIWPRSHKSIPQAVTNDGFRPRHSVEMQLSYSSSLGSEKLQVCVDQADIGGQVQTAPSR